MQMMSRQVTVPRAEELEGRYMLAVCAEPFSHSITHADGMSSDRDRSLLSVRLRYDSGKAQGKNGLPYIS